MAIDKLKGHKSPGMDQIPAELIKAGGRTIRSEINNLLILFEIRSNCLRSGMSRSFYLFIRRVIEMVVIVESYSFCQLFCQLHTKFYPTPNNFLRKIIRGSWRKLLGVHHCGLRLSRSATDHILCVRQILEKKMETR